MSIKPHLGRITAWSKYPCEEGLGYLIVGRFLDHPQFAGRRGHTSYVVDFLDASGEIETRNSRYTLVGDAP